MKDEEMANKLAEEYVKHWIVGEDDNALMQEAYKDGFLEGLKAGKLQWHKVVDGDLPKIENRIVLCVCIGGYINNEPNYVYKLLTSREFCLFQPVIAWCEIPTFDKE